MRPRFQKPSRTYAFDSLP
ncbi:MAG: hypothetical protein K2W85_10195 [Phycisphaerales bacterium]|nr:hypothetical protein [Phycisphaerales bacterium]